MSGAGLPTFLQPGSPWQVHIDHSTCTGCGDCVRICSVHALEPVGGKARLARPAACTYCAQCEAICPAGAIALPYQVVVASGA